MAEKDSPPKYDEDLNPDGSTAFKSISIRLIQQIPGQEDAIIRQVDENVIIPCTASRDDVTKLLESRVKFHFGLNTSAAHKEAIRVLSVVIDCELYAIADDEQWQASTGRLANGATLQYDLVMRAALLANVVASGSSIASKSVVATLTQRTPGKISADGERMGMNMSPSAVVRQIHDAILITSNATWSQVFLLLLVRIKAHFRIDLSPDHIAPQGYASMVMAYKDKRISLVDELGWEAARGWLDTGAVLEVDFAVPETKEAEHVVSASRSAAVTAISVAVKKEKEPSPPPYDYTQAQAITMPTVVKINHRKSGATSVQTVNLINISPRKSIVSSQHDAIFISRATTRSELCDMLVASINRNYKEKCSNGAGKYFIHIASVFVNDARIRILDDESWEASRAFLLLERATLQVDFTLPPVAFCDQGVAGADGKENVMQAKRSHQKKRGQQKMCIVQ
ncbi:hypothetical protein LTR97_004049 [Elasticomyces elasticus]|uniref:Uncharacterized protein n=1 Tax=Elasticomyces elasticus TaxID=574655 RepID=A0AAN8A3Z4_9PEZI|nr:hypothetical protein LTR97_004049 [Elasticomyces elasticus]